MTKYPCDASRHLHCGSYSCALLSFGIQGAGNEGMGLGLIFRCHGFAGNNGLLECCYGNIFVVTLCCLMPRPVPYLSRAPDMLSLFA